MTEQPKTQDPAHGFKSIAEFARAVAAAASGECWDDRLVRDPQCPFDDDGGIMADRDCDKD